MASRNYIATVGWITAAALVGAGVITIVIGLAIPMGAASFGWFAYQPLANTKVTPGGSAIVVSPVTIVGWVVLAVGLITLAFLAGRLVGRRSDE